MFYVSVSFSVVFLVMWQSYKWCYKFYGKCPAPAYVLHALVKY